MGGGGRVGMGCGTLGGVALVRAQCVADALGVPVHQSPAAF